jgi:hypothetical protein
LFSPWTGVNGKGLSLGLIILVVVWPSVEVDGSGLSLGFVHVDELLVEGPGLGV